MTNELLFFSKNDIPFVEARVNIHQPTIREISLIDEENFHIGCQFLNFSIDNLSDEDKVNLRERTDFEIFMSAMNSKDSAKFKTNALLVLTLLFPEYNIKLEKDKILLSKGEMVTSIENRNFNSFKEILVNMFCLAGGGKYGRYNPADGRAKKIAEKLQKAEVKVNKGKNVEKFSIYKRYISILSIGNHQDINVLMEYTVPQLMEAMKRYQAKQDFDLYLKAKLAGAQDLEEVKNWMEDLSSDN